MNPASVLVVSDQTEFASTLLARWQAEREVPAFTLLSSGLWNGEVEPGYELVIVGPVLKARMEFVLTALDCSSVPAIVVPGDDAVVAALRAAHPRLLVLPRLDGWADALLLVSAEALRRSEALARARRAERAEAASQRLATLGQYMLDMRHSLNNAMTGVIGNADLLLLEPAQSSAQAREQIRAIHTMALRLHEILQRFSSLASELEFAEKESQAETQASSHASVPGS